MAAISEQSKEEILVDYVKETLLKVALAEGDTATAAHNAEGGEKERMNYSILK